MCEMVLMMLAISLAAAMQRTLLSDPTEAPSLFLSALKMAAWCRQMVEVWMLMLAKTTLGLDRPAGSLRWAGRQSDVLRSMLSMWRWRFQKHPSRSSSRSSSSGRCRCTRLRPKMQASRTTAPNDDSFAAPEGLIDSASVCMCSGRLRSKASSEAGSLVMTSRSSMVMGQPVPMLA